MRIFKNLLTLFMAMVILLSFVACTPVEESSSLGGDSSTIEDSSSSVEDIPPVYNPSVIGDSVGNFFVDDPKNVEFNMDLNTGAFESLSIGETLLTKNNEYRFSLGTEILTIEKDYLLTLDEGVKTFVFATDKGSCEVQVEINGSLIAGYNMSFAKPLNFNEPDLFFSKVSRDESGVKFDFLTYGDFTTEGTSLKFVNVYLDMPALNNEAINWKLNSEDANVRVYSDGSVYLFTQFTGLADNLWFHMDFEDYENGIYRGNGQKAYSVGERLSDVVISREKGVTTFSLVIPYEKVGIAADTAFRFYLKECSDAGINDFNMYEGDLIVDGVQLGDPFRCTNWATLTPAGEVLTNTANLMTFSKNEGNIEEIKAIVSVKNGAVNFDFATLGDFGNGGADKEFINLYIDMPALNPQGNNWCFKTEDVNVRIYSDGSVYLMAKFDGSADNLWYKMDFEGYANGIYRNGNKVIESVTKLDDVIITRADGLTTFSLSLSLEQLGNASATELRFYLKECCENSGPDFALYAGDMKYNYTTQLGDPFQCTNFATLTVATGKVTTP